MSIRLSTITTVLAFSVIPTIASAHAGNNDPNVVHACIGNVSKVVRIVGVSGSCFSAPPWLAETPAHWDIRGAPGTNGTNGIDGTSVTFVGNFSGNEHGCPNGGAIFSTGAVNAYVCNGQGAATGATRPDGPCYDNTNRYVDCGNGTVTDTVTGLIWVQYAGCFGSLPPYRRDWAAANVAAAQLKDGDCGLTDKSSPGDWRLPTKDEWSATIARAVALGCTGFGPGTGPSLTNDAGTACQSVGPSSLTGLGGDLYFSSTTDEHDPVGAWFVSLGSGVVGSFDGLKVHTLLAWPVRGGPH